MKYIIFLLQFQLWNVFSPSSSALNTFTFNIYIIWYWQWMCENVLVAGKTEQLHTWQAGTSLIPYNPIHSSRIYTDLGLCTLAYVTIVLWISLTIFFIDPFDSLPFKQTLKKVKVEMKRFPVSDWKSPVSLWKLISCQSKPSKTDPLLSEPTSGVQTII